MNEKVFKQLLKDTLNGFGANIRDDGHELVQYMAARAAHLSTLVDQPGFAEAVIAERNNVALEAGIRAVEAADEADARAHQFIYGVLMTLATLGT